jgi:FtsH-binding integral membrane protein
MENSIYSRSYSYRNSENVAMAFPALMRKVYVWMTLALVVTALSAYYVATTPEMLYAVFSNRMVFFGLLIAEVLMVVGMTALINKVSFMVAALMMAAYSVLNGVTMSAIFVIYDMASIATTFFVTAGTFASMAIVGYATKKDLTKMGGILMMAVIGLVIASVVNWFLQSETMAYIVSGIGVLVFTGLTAYDSQKIKNMLMQCDTVNDGTQKLALLGSLTLYLDFVNLFLYLLRFMGNRK